MSSPVDASFKPNTTTLPQRSASDKRELFGISASCRGKGKIKTGFNIGLARQPLCLLPPFPLCIR